MQSSISATVQRGYGGSEMPNDPLPTRSVWSGVAWVVLSGVIASMHFGKVAIATPLLQLEYAVGLDAIGWLAAAFATIGALAAVPAGTLIRPDGARHMLIIGMLTIGGGSALGAWSDSWTMLAASRLVEGLGFVLVTVSGPVVVLRLVAMPDRNRAMALWGCFVPAGIALDMCVGPWFDRWRELWWAGAILAAAVVAPLLVRVRNAPPRARSPAEPLRRALAEALRVKGPLAAASCFLLYSLMFFALFSFLPVLLVERLGVESSTVGPLGALASAANVVGNLAAGWAVERTGRARLLGLAACTMALCTPLVFFASEHPLLAYAMCVLFSAAGGLVPGTLLSSAPLLSPSPLRTPLVIALAMQGSSLGQALGPSLLGWAIERHGWPAAGFVVLAAAALMVLTALRLHEALSERRQ